MIPTRKILNKLFLNASVKMNKIMADVFLLKACVPSHRAMLV